MFQANPAPRPGSLTLATIADQDHPEAAYANGVVPAQAPLVMPPFTVTSSLCFSDDADWRLFDQITLPAELETAIDRRKLHFRLGRLCAARALQQLNPGQPSGPLGRDAAGVPSWPRAITGSITHASGFASAAVAWTRHAMSLGIDVERTMSARQAQKVARVIASAEELAVAEHALGNALTAVTVVFCAKEAVFKALYPLVRHRFGYADARLIAIDSASRTFDVRLVTTLSASFRSGIALRGHYASAGEWVHAGLVIPADHEHRGGAGYTADSQFLRS
jgi:enterobactin synthetase component D